MRRSLRFFAVFVLALLGAPVAMHVVVHDLHDHHGDHEHPVVSSPAPEVASVVGVALPIATAPAATPVTWPSIAATDRNIVSHGALRTDNDVGLQPLLATFLI